MGHLLWIGAGGFVGAILRYVVSALAQNWSGSTSWPVGTLAVNVLGSFLIGAVGGALDQWRLPLSADARLFLVVGGLGAFTTFSAFSAETLALMRGHGGLWGAANAAAQVGFCLLAVWAGSAISR